ncbi:Uncharacterised protein [Collinsella intestinalis]|nr:Uncharacterised protein [Collinsella intestinalis]
MQRIGVERIERRLDLALLGVLDVGEGLLDVIEGDFARHALIALAGRKVACEGELERAVILESKFLAEARDRRF